MGPRRPFVLLVLLALVAGSLVACSGDDGATSESRPARTSTTTIVPTATTTVPGPAGAEPRLFTSTGARSGFAHGFELVRRESPADVEADLDLIAGTGARWLRASVGWGHIERSPGVYDWAGTDRVVLGARNRGLSVVAVISSAPSWNSARGCRTYECAPEDLAPFAAFARVAAQRYSLLGVHHWEIWNEPNHVPFWAPRPDPVVYTEMLRQTYPAIHAVDPQAVVMTGGLSPAPDRGAEISPLTFLRRVYELGGGRYFDAVAHHPYQYPNHPLSPEATNAFQQTARIHELMVGFGDGDKKIWGTEVGAPTRGSRSVSEDDQAVWLREYYGAWNNWRFTGPLLWYTARDKDAGNHIEDSYGIVRNDRTPKPAYRSFEEMVRSTAPLPRDARSRE